MQKRKIQEDSVPISPEGKKPKGSLPQEAKSATTSPVRPDPQISPVPNQNIKEENKQNKSPAKSDKSTTAPSSPKKHDSSSNEDKHKLDAASSPKKDNNSPIKDKQVQNTSPSLKATSLFGGKGTATWDEFEEKEKPTDPKTNTKVSEKNAGGTVKDLSGAEIKFGHTTTFGSFLNKEQPKPTFSTSGGPSFGSKSPILKAGPQLVPVKDQSTSFTSIVTKAGADAKDSKSSFAALLEEKTSEDQEATVDFKPVVTLEETEVITGEEDEETLLSTRCKLFHLDPEQKWKERGVGVLKLNVRKDHKGKARLVMRTDGVFKLVLNIQVLKDMPCEVVQEKFVRMIGCEAPGELTTFLVKVSKKETADLFVSQIKKITT